MPSEGTAGATKQCLQRDLGRKQRGALEVSAGSDGANKGGGKVWFWWELLRDLSAKMLHGPA